MVGVASAKFTAASAVALALLSFCAAVGPANDSPALLSTSSKSPAAPAAPAAVPPVAVPAAAGAPNIPVFTSICGA